MKLHAVFRVNKEVDYALLCISILDLLRKYYVYGTLCDWRKSHRSATEQHIPIELAIRTRSSDYTGSVAYDGVLDGDGLSNRCTSLEL